MSLRTIIARAGDPTATAFGRRAELVVEVLRDWAEPMTVVDLRQLLDWSSTNVRMALDLLIADGRVGRVPGPRPYRYYADPDITQTLVPRT